MCDRWGKDYRAIKLLRNNADYKAYMTYLNYAPEIQSMIYTTNWIERLNRDFRRVTRMRTAMPNEESVLILMGSVAMENKAFDRALPNITIREFGIINIKKVEVVVYSPYVPVMVPAYSRKNNMRQVPSIDSL